MYTYYLGSIGVQSWCPNRKHWHLINNRKKTFCSIFRILDKAYLELDFEIKIIEIHRLLSEINYFKIEHSKFCRINCVIFNAIAISQS